MRFLRKLARHLGLRNTEGGNMVQGTRLSKLARDLNVGISTIVEFLHKKGFKIDENPNSRVAAEHVDLLNKEFKSDSEIKKESEKLSRSVKQRKETISIEDAIDEPADDEDDLDFDNAKTPKLVSKTEPTEIKKAEKTILPSVEEPSKTSKGPIILGKIDLEPKKEKTKKAEIPSEKAESKTDSLKPDTTISPDSKAEVTAPEVTPKQVQEITPEQPEQTIEEVAKKEVQEEIQEVVQQVVQQEEVQEVVSQEEVQKVVSEEVVDEVVTEEVTKAEKETKIEETKAEETILSESDEKQEIKKEPLVEPLSDADEKSSSVDIRVIGKIDLDTLNQKVRPSKKTRKEREEEKAANRKTSVKTSNPAIPGEKPSTTKPEPDRSKGKTEETPKQKVEPRVSIPSKDDTASIPEVPVEIKKIDDNFLATKFEKLSGLTVVGKIVLPVEDKRKGKVKPVASSSKMENAQKKKRKRILKEKIDVPNPVAQKDSDKKIKRPAKPVPVKKVVKKTEVTDEDVQKQIKDTLARLTSKGKTKTAKHRRQKRDDVRSRQHDEHMRDEEQSKILKINEFVTVSELASMMSLQPVQIISTCMTLGLFVSINQRLDAETMSLVAEEFGFQVSFITIDEEDIYHAEEELAENLLYRPPIVTVMGHVDHGKTSLLDYIRSANVIAGEAGGITQHIGAYSVRLKDGRMMTFLDTPGHEAFTAMRARGAKVTDIVIIVVAADDDVMPQTIEAINHASAAGVPIVFAINKIDKPTANPEKIKEALAAMNYLVEEWGGKYQSHDISAKQGLHIEELLEKVLLEAELLDLKANPNKRAHGTVIESSLDKGRGYVANILVQSGTLKIGDILLAGPNYGHIKAMFNERGKKISEAGPSSPVLILGLNGAPQAGDKFNVLSSEREAREIANKREQLIREQGLRTKKHITLDEIGRRIAIGNFQELNIIVKGDVDGSVEALADSLIKLSTPEIQINVKHKAVGQISESDVLLAAASDAIIVGFQVRPSLSARKLAEKEEIDIRLYSIIYDAINEMKDAMEGMLSPDIKEEIVATLEIREVFKITKVGSVAGCIVKEGKLKRNTKIRLIREGIVVYTGELGSLKRFKEDVKEVSSGYECGLNIHNFNDIKTGDIIEGYQETEVRKTL